MSDTEERKMLGALTDALAAHIARADAAELADVFLDALGKILLITSLPGDSRAACMAALCVSAQLADVASMDDRAQKICVVLIETVSTS